MGSESSNYLVAHKSQWELDVKLELEFEHTYILINISAD